MKRTAEICRSHIISNRSAPNYNLLVHDLHARNVTRERRNATQERQERYVGTPGTLRGNARNAAQDRQERCAGTSGTLRGNVMPPGNATPEFEGVIYKVKIISTQYNIPRRKT